ncbi:MAG: 16S rRNA (adenine(1518)-N(6)/adenine(1519)-N(6))-dimethyltransferase RsmA [Acidobacteria bacterium]|jgi:16S rRNA (adenine1518-N6/adenine1519-N6)-dimethyltransferase|nr:16S rRNA (adenine(1518)-N(6)/adenine(1519)-N(6))-dimethyltransferase RsmA [Acidobacteriota bacterium]
MPASAKLGQNFLHNKNIAAKIINAFLPQTGAVLEIGPGPGILSGLLLEHVPAERVTLVEIDRFLAGELRKRFGDPPRIIEEDILKIDLARLYPQDRVAVVGNLPYHISKELIDWFICQRGRISAAVLMLQKDFVDKVLAVPGGKKYNAQSVLFQLLFRTRRCFHVPAGAFSPAPRIMSTVITVQPADITLAGAAGEFYPFVKLCFAERRKTLWNNLSPHYGAAALQAAFAVAAIPAQARAEQLPARTFHEVFLALSASTWP